MKYGNLIVSRYPNESIIVHEVDEQNRKLNPCVIKYLSFDPLTSIVEIQINTKQEVKTDPISEEKHISKMFYEILNSKKQRENKNG